MAEEWVLVSEMHGQAWVRSSDGSLQVLRVGMQVPRNADIVTTADTQLTVVDSLGQRSSWAAAETPDAAVAQHTDSGSSLEAAAADADTPPFPLRVQRVSDEDPYEALDPTAATLESGVGAGGRYLRVDGVVEHTQALDMGFAAGVAPASQDGAWRAGAVQLPGVLPDLSPFVPPAVSEPDPPGASYQASGNLLMDDVTTTGARAQLLGSGNGSLVQLVLKADGSFHAQVDLSFAQLQALQNGGAPLEEQFAYQLVNVNAPGLRSQPVYFTVMVVNDPDFPVRLLEHSTGIDPWVTVWEFTQWQAQTQRGLADAQNYVDQWRDFLAQNPDQADYYQREMDAALERQQSLQDRVGQQQADWEAVWDQMYDGGYAAWLANQPDASGRVASAAEPSTALGWSVDSEADSLEAQAAAQPVEPQGLRLAATDGPPLRLQDVLHDASADEAASLAEWLPARPMPSAAPAAPQAAEGDAWSALGAGGDAASEWAQQLLEQGKQVQPDV